MANIDHYEGEDVIMTFEAEGLDTVTCLEGKITRYSRTGGARSVETRHLFGNRSIGLTKPREKFTISFDFITKDPTFTHMSFGGSSATHNNGEVLSSATPKRWRIGLWFLPYANTRANTTSADVRVPTKSAPVGECLRILHCDCEPGNCDYEFDVEDMLKGSITFELTAVDEDGYANIIEEYQPSGTTSITICTTTCASHKGQLNYVTTAASVAWTGSYRT